MTSPESQDRAKRKRVAAGYNQATNLFWSVVCLGPLVYFGYSKMAPVWTYTFLAISALPVFLPNSFFDSIQLSRTVSSYTKLGIRIVRKYTQDGDVINQLLRKQFPPYVPISPTPVEKHLVKSYVNEKFHYVGFLFFLLTSLYAAI